MVSSAQGQTFDNVCSSLSFPYSYSYSCCNCNVEVPSSMQLWKYFVLKTILDIPLSKSEKILYPMCILNPSFSPISTTNALILITSFNYYPCILLPVQSHIKLLLLLYEVLLFPTHSLAREPEDLMFLTHLFNLSIS